MRIAAGIAGCMIPSLEIGAELSARVLRSVTEVKQISSDWRDLFYRCHATVFQSPDWLLPWIEAFSPENIMVVEVRCADRLVGLAPLLIYRRGSERVLAFMGGGVSDYLDVLVDPGFEPQAIFEIFCAVMNSHEEWTVLDLTDLPSHSALLRIPFFHHSAREHDFCSVLHLPQTREELLQLFSKRQRANLRNARSRLERAGGGQFEIATAENLSEFLGDLFTLHTNRWSEQRQSGVLDNERVRAFHGACAPALLQSGLLHLSRLRLANRTIAVIYSLLSHRTAYCYLQGFDPEFSSLSPGTQLMFSVMNDTLARRMREFDFLRGREAYKQHWRAESKPTFRIQVPREILATIPRRRRGQNRRRIGE
jgi:CelD/BcsL family acetyltransferase involved in cellulose biosynthesis